MPNTLGNYNEIFFAQEALIQLQNALGMAARVHRDFDPTPSVRGDSVRIRRPSRFSAQDAPSPAQNLDTESISVQLNKWRDVRFALTDKELTQSSEKIITDHIQPAAYEIARDIDADLNTLWSLVPNVSQASGTFALEDLTKPHQVLFDLGVPMDETNIHMQVNGAMQAAILGKLGGQNIMGAGVDNARLRGAMGQLFGINLFANQQTPKHTTTQIADVDGTVTGVHAKGVESVAIGGITISQTPAVRAGDTLVFANHAQRYAVTANANSDGAGAATLAISPPLKVALAGGEVVSIDKRTGGEKAVNGLFHRNAFCLAMAPLSTLGQELGGARMAVATDDKTGLALRSTMWYDPGSAAVNVRIDALWGKKLLDENMATRFYSA